MSNPPPLPPSSSRNVSEASTEVVGPAAFRRRFRVISTIGMGSFGVVHRASVWGTTQSCALKTISKDGRTLQDVDILKREIKISRELNHPGIVLTVWAFETAACLVVVQERALGDLYKLLRDDGRLPEHRVKDIARQLVSALEYIHSKRVIHRDLKPQNILVLSGGRVALCDFGFARSVSAQTALLTTIKGTPLYMAPEVVQEFPYNHTADIWSLGIILYELYQGAPPFWGDSLVALMRKVVRRPFTMPSDVSPEFALFLTATLEKDPARRISWPALTTHPFVALSPTEEAALPATQGDYSRLQHQQNARFEATGRSRLLAQFRPRNTMEVKGNTQSIVSPDESDSNKSPSLLATAAVGPVALPPPLPPVTRSTSTFVTGEDQSDEAARDMLQLAEMKPLARSESIASGGAASPMLPFSLSRSVETEETEEERMLMKDLLDRLFFFSTTGAVISVPSEEEVLSGLRSSQARKNLLVKLIERFEVSKSAAKKWETVQMGTRLIRRLVRLGVAIPSETIRVLVAVLVADDDPKVASQGLKCLDTILSKDHSLVLSYILKPTFMPRLVECPLIPLILECFERSDEKLLRAATHVSLSLLSIPSGWRVSRLFSQHITSPVLQILMTTLEAPCEAEDAEETTATKTEILRILSRLSACPSGTVARTIASSASLRGSIERLAFSSPLQNWPAISVVEYLCRFGCPKNEHKEQWIRWAIEHVDRIALEMPHEQRNGIGGAKIDHAYFSVNASLRVILEAHAPLPPSRIKAASGFAQRVLKLMLSFTAVTGALYSTDFESFYAVTEHVDLAGMNRAHWDVLWRTARNPNEAVHALNARLNCIQCNSNGVATTKAIAEKLPVLIGETLSKRFIQSVEQYPKSLGGGRFGARRIYRAGLRLIVESLKRSPRTQDSLVFLQQFFDLDGIRLLTFHVQRYMEDDPLLLSLYASVCIQLMRVNCSKSAKGMMEIPGISRVLERTMELDWKLGIRMFGLWSRAGGSAFELCLPKEAMGRLFARMTRAVHEIATSVNGNDELDDVKEVCLAVGNVCRRTGKYNDQLSGLFEHLVSYLTGLSSRNQAIEDAIALAVGNAAFHSDTLYPILVKFVPNLLELIKDPSAEPKARANAALAIGNLLRNGESTDSLLAKTDACAVLLNAYHATKDVLERRVILLSLGNFAGRPRCRAALRDRFQEELRQVVDQSLSDEDAEVKTAAQRINEKMQQH